MVVRKWVGGSRWGGALVVGMMGGRRDGLFPLEFCHCLLPYPFGGLRYLIAVFMALLFPGFGDTSFLAATWPGRGWADGRSEGCMRR